jgi:hypothetical protein
MTHSFKTEVLTSVWILRSGIDVRSKTGAVRDTCSTVHVYDIFQAIAHPELMHKHSVHLRRLTEILHELSTTCQ